MGTEATRGQRSKLVYDASNRRSRVEDITSHENEWTISRSAASEFAMLKRETLINTLQDGVCPRDEIWKEFCEKYRDRIVAIKEIIPNKVYEYIFGDRDVQKTVCSDSDQFSMEDSITIAYAKHFMGGSGRYNRAVDKAMKLFANQKAAEEKAKKEAKAAKVRQERKIKKRAERIARKREAEIELQAEAYRRAMQSMEAEKSKEA